MTKNLILDEAGLNRAVGAYGTAMVHAGYIVTLNEDEIPALEYAIKEAVLAYLDQPE